jgi:hypothetical protein
MLTCSNPYGRPIQFGPVAVNWLTITPTLIGSAGCCCGGGSWAAADAISTHSARHADASFVSTGHPL